MGHEPRRGHTLLLSWLQKVFLSKQAQFVFEHQAPINNTIY